MRTLIVDDHALFAEGLRHLLRAASDPSEIQCCRTEEEALAIAQNGDVDLVLLDWHLGGSHGGAGTLHAIREVAPAARVVIISGESDPSVIRKAIDLGASGFVPKGSSPQIMIDALAITAHGGIYLPAEALAEIDAISNRTPSKQSPILGGDISDNAIERRFPQLTARQLDVLRQTVRGMSNKEIARILNISEGTVKQHLVAVFRELQVQSRTEAVYVLAKSGIRFV